MPEIAHVKNCFGCSPSNPARIKDRLSIQTTLKEEKSRTIILEAHVYSGDTVIAEAIGILFKVKKPS